MVPSRWDLLQDLSEPEVQDILSLSTPVSLEDGGVLFDLGDEAREVFLVVQGLVKLSLPLTVGDRQLDAMVGERAPGHMVGWSSMIPPHRFTVKATAVGRTELLSLPRSKLMGRLEARPELGYRVLTNVARIIGQRLQVFQTLWIREMQHVVRTRTT